MEALVYHDFLDVAVLMRIDLVFRLRVPFSRANFQFLWLFPINRMCIIKELTSDKQHIQMQNSIYFHVQTYEHKLYPYSDT